MERASFSLKVVRRLIYQLIRSSILKLSYENFWSLSENNDNNTWKQNFNNGNQNNNKNNNNKNNKYVRAVQGFKLACTSALFAEVLFYFGYSNDKCRRDF